MDCPACREPMIVMELHEVEIDHCLECGGIWLDEGELEFLLGGHDLSATFLSSFVVTNESTEKKHKCPICFKKMEKVLVGPDGNTCIDRCGKKDGLWFDRGELAELVGQGSTDSENKVLELLEDMFGKNLNEEAD